MDGKQYSPDTPPLYDDVFPTEKEPPISHTIYQSQLGVTPITVWCPHCNKETITEVQFKDTWVKHLTAFVFCILSGCLCALIPYWFDWPNDVVHVCSSCDGYIGTMRESPVKPVHHRSST